MLRRFNVRFPVFWKSYVYMTQKKEIMVKFLYLINFTYEKGDKP
uniref:Uncharacterized protein n=1 Tax=Siphoviridae sp. ctXmm2 TaxID=2825546 RepID=A0A8S5QHE6_9CAUD|nr:MAG TPA: hypothetical protein [Siphoviridae sp. ctXmm2]